MSTTVWAEFASAEGLLVAAKELRGRGLSQLDAYTPYELPELASLLSLRAPRWFSRLVLGAATAGGVGAYAVIAWTTHDYPLNVGGRPLASLPADLPILFESSILAAAVAAFATVLALLKMPRLHHPLERLTSFRRVSNDRYWLGVALLEEPISCEVSQWLQRSGALCVHRLDEDDP